MLKVATLASGSSGNCTVVSDGYTHILIDAGISAKRIISGLRQLGIEPEKVSAVLITHEHSDHIAALPVLTKYIKGDIYTTEPTARQICYRVAGIEDRFRVFDPGDRFLAGGLVAEGFATSHDCACPVGYTLTDGRRKLALCTDTGVVTQEILQTVRGADTLIGEFNYDVDMLRSGPYPAYLKQRILGDRGHLSNEMGGELALFAVEQGARRIIMGHLSKENNLPSVAMAAARKALEGRGVRIGRDMELLAAPRSEATDWMEV